MNVPLYVRAEYKSGKEKLIIWSNNKKIEIDAPIKPYFYSLKLLNIPAKVTKVRAIRLSDFQEKTFYKYEFNSREELVKHRIKGVTFEDNIPFILRNRIDNPDLFTKYANTNDLKFLFIDIEQYCPPEKHFPTYEDRIISLSFAENDQKVRTIYLKKVTQTDLELLKKFKAFYNKPDVIVLYNKFYDLPTIYERCKRNNLDTKWLSKFGEEPRISKKFGLHIEGTIVYDILDSVRNDQSLTGNVPNRGLKAVSNYFGYKGVELDTTDISKFIGTKELIEYNKEDVKRLFFLFDIYWETIIRLAEDLKIPLSEAVNLSVTDLAIIVLGDLYKKHNIIADGDNFTRYPEIFQRKKKQGESNYQGALVFIKKRGLFKPVFKADYSSMYPSIIASFNFSPDTLTLLGYTKYKRDGFKIEEDKDSFTYYIPDYALRKTVIIQVAKRKGFLSEAVHHFLKERAKYKKEYKQTGSKVALARSNIAKVKANGGIYGVMGAPHHPFGYAPIAVATTGIGRECAKLLIDVLEKLYPDSVIEVDTDGVYFSTENYNKERIIYYFNQALKEKFKKELNLSIDIDKFDAGYFHKAKNYILKRGNTIILHGVAIKASNKDGISKKLIYSLAESKLEGQPTDDIVKRFESELEKFEIDDFAMQVTLGKPLNAYKSKNCIPLRMAVKAYQHLGIKPVPGNVYHYVKTVYGYELLQLTKKQDIDYKYYREKVKRIVKMFESEYAIHKPVSWFTDGEVTEIWEDSESIKEGKPKTFNVEDFF
ncbi:MAG: DNA polymerase domain-containing protein [Candidatus Heimdallarchaeaceae archaeon]